MKRITSALALGFALATSLFANPIVPVSYSYNQGGASGSYPDSGTVELTDGLYNGLVPQQNLATPNANNWVGFDYGYVPSITFNFANSVTIDNVSISMARWQEAGVYLPSQVTVGSSNFSVNANSYANQDHALLSFNGSWTGSSLTVALTAGGYWTFIDEVTFNQAQGNGNGNQVPDSAGTLGLMSLSAALLVAARRRFSK